jgi:hypothetical protein
MEKELLKDWLINQGYYSKQGSLVWWKNDKIADGDELRRKLNEWKALANTNKKTNNK